MSGLISGRGIKKDANHLTVSSDSLQVNLNANHLEATGSGVGLKSTIGGSQITFSTTPAISNAPAAATDAVNKAYVDGISAGLAWKDSARVVAVSNINIASPGASIDSVALSAGQRILLTAQSTGSQNGLWVWNGAASALTRPTDFPAGSGGASTTVSIDEGTVYADTVWRCTTDAGSDVVDTNTLTFTQLPLISYTAGNGILITGSSIAVKPDVTTGGDTAAVTVGANGVGVDVTTLDGDHLDVDFTPTNYTPTTTGAAEAADVDDLAAHLKGIDNALASVGSSSLTQEIFTLNSTDISNSYVALAVDPVAASVHAMWTEGGSAVDGDGVDVGLVADNRVNWAAHAWEGVLAAGDVLVITYEPA